MTKTPYMSVIINTLNGAGTIGRTIESLMAQDYPRDRYEIIVIDDGSTDNLAEVVATYPVRYYYQPNAGVSSARNLGLKHAKGDIFVGIDDDCLASSNLLSELAAGYEHGNPIGVGGYIADPVEIHGLVGHYMVATGSGPAPVTGTKNATSLIGRFTGYIKSKFADQIIQDQPQIEVGELYGANGSYQMSDLRAIGGWNLDMHWIEDRDLSLRLRKAFPNRPFYARRDAKIVHDPELTLMQYLLRLYKRGIDNLRFHQYHNITVPIFPFPLATIAVVAAVTVWQPLWFVPAVIVVPQLFYFWWPVRSVKKRKPLYLVFAYLQLAEEGLAVAGLLRGYVQQKRDARA